MKEFVKMTVAVTVGTLAASAIAAKVVLSEKFLRAYTKKAVKLSQDIAADMFESEREDYLD